MRRLAGSDAAAAAAATLAFHKQKQQQQQYGLTTRCEAGMSGAEAQRRATERYMAAPPRLARPVAAGVSTCLLRNESRDALLRNESRDASLRNESRDASLRNESSSQDASCTGSSFRESPRNESRSNESLARDASYAGSPRNESKESLRNETPFTETLSKKLKMPVAPQRRLPAPPPSASSSSSVSPHTPRRLKTRLGADGDEATPLPVVVTLKPSPPSSKPKTPTKASSEPKTLIMSAASNPKTSITSASSNPKTPITSASSKPKTPTKSTCSRIKTPTKAAFHKENAPTKPPPPAALPKPNTLAKSALYEEKAPTKPAAYREQTPTRSVLYNEKTPTKSVLYNEKTPAKPPLQSSRFVSTLAAAAPSNPTIASTLSPSPSSDALTFSSSDDKQQTRTQSPRKPSPPASDVHTRPWRALLRDDTSVVSLSSQSSSHNHLHPPPSLRRSSSNNASSSPSPTRKLASRRHRNSSAGTLQLDSLTNAIMAGSLASARLTPHTTGSSLPPPSLPVRQRSPRLLSTLRHGSVSDSDDAHKPKRLHRHKLHAKHAHHEGSRKRWREEMTERERKRYEAVWASNRGWPWIQDGDAETEADGSVLGPGRERAQCVVNVVVREIWKRSRLPDDELAEVWELVDRDRRGMLTRQEFVVGMWLIDQRLRGRKLPHRVSESVWASANGMTGTGKKSRFK